MAATERDTLGATFKDCISGKDHDDAIVLELVPDYADDTCLSILIPGHRLPKALLHGFEFFSGAVRQTSQLRPTDDDGTLKKEDIKMQSVTDRVILCRTHNDTIHIELLRDDFIVFQTDIALDDFTRLITGRTIKIDFTVTKHVAG